MGGGGTPSRRLGVVPQEAGGQVRAASPPRLTSESLRWLRLGSRPFPPGGGGGVVVVSPSPPLRCLLLTMSKPGPPPQPGSITTGRQLSRKSRGAARESQRKRHHLERGGWGAALSRCHLERCCSQRRYCRECGTNAERSHLGCLMPPSQTSPSGVSQSLLGEIVAGILRCLMSLVN